MLCRQHWQLPHLPSLLLAQLLKRLRHDNIIGYFASFIEDDALHIVLEYADGGDLSQLIKAKRESGEYFSEKQIMWWFVQMCLAMSYLHKTARVLHRDLKTQNIFLTRNQQVVKLGDFGIAKVLSDTGTMKSMASTVIGTPFYMSPELCESKPYNHKSDVWALGCVLYEMATLRHAFGSASLGALVLKILRGTYPPIDETRYSANFRGMVDWMLQSDPENRPSVEDIIHTSWVSRLIKWFQSESGAQASSARAAVGLVSETIMRGAQGKRLMSSAVAAARAEGTDAQASTATQPGVHVPPHAHKAALEHTQPGPTPTSRGRGPPRKPAGATRAWPTPSGAAFAPAEPAGTSRRSSVSTDDGRELYPTPKSAQTGTAASTSTQQHTAGSAHSAAARTHTSESDSCDHGDSSAGHSSVSSSPLRRGLRQGGGGAAMPVRGSFSAIYNTASISGVPSPSPHGGQGQAFELQGPSTPKQADSRRHPSTNMPLPPPPSGPPPQLGRQDAHPPRQRQSLSQEARRGSLDSRRASAPRPLDLHGRLSGGEEEAEALAGVSPSRPQVADGGTLDGPSAQLQDSMSEEPALLSWRKNSLVSPRRDNGARPYGTHGRLGSRSSSVGSAGVLSPGMPTPTTRSARSASVAALTPSTSPTTSSTDSSASRHDQAPSPKALADHILSDDGVSTSDYDRSPQAAERTHQSWTTAKGTQERSSPADRLQGMDDEHATSGAGWDGQDDGWDPDAVDEEGLRMYDTQGREVYYELAFDSNGDPILDEDGEQMLQEMYVHEDDAAEAAAEYEAAQGTAQSMLSQTPMDPLLQIQSEVQAAVDAAVDGPPHRSSVPVFEADLHAPLAAGSQEVWGSFVGTSSDRSLGSKNQSSDRPATGTKVPPQPSRHVSPVKCAASAESVTRAPRPPPSEEEEFPGEFVAPKSVAVPPMPPASTARLPRVSVVTRPGELQAGSSEAGKHAPGTEMDASLPLRRVRSAESPHHAAARDASLSGHGKVSDLRKAQAARFRAVDLAAMGSTADVQGDDVSIKSDAELSASWQAPSARAAAALGGSGRLAGPALSVRSDSSASTATQDEAAAPMLALPLAGGQWTPPQGSRRASAPHVASWQTASRPPTAPRTAAAGRRASADQASSVVQEGAKPVHQLVNIFERMSGRAGFGGSARRLSIGSGGGGASASSSIRRSSSLSAQVPGPISEVDGGGLRSDQQLSAGHPGRGSKPQSSRKEASALKAGGSSVPTDQLGMSTGSGTGSVGSSGRFSASSGARAAPPTRLDVQPLQSPAPVAQARAPVGSLPQALKQSVTPEDAPSPFLSSTGEIAAFAPTTSRRTSATSTTQAASTTPASTQYTSKAGVGGNFRRASLDCTPTTKGVAFSANTQASLESKPTSRTVAGGSEGRDPRSVGSSAGTPWSSAIPPSTTSAHANTSGEASEPSSMRGSLTHKSLASSAAEVSPLLTAAAPPARDALGTSAGAPWAPPADISPLQRGTSSSAKQLATTGVPPEVLRLQETVAELRAACIAEVGEAVFHKLHAVLSAAEGEGGLDSLAGMDAGTVTMGIQALGKVIRLQKLEEQLAAAMGASS